MSERRERERHRRENHIDKELLLLEQLIEQKAMIKRLRELVADAGWLMQDASSTDQKIRKWCDRALAEGVYDGDGT
jgi:hypothetical protein